MALLGKIHIWFCLSILALASGIEEKSPDDSLFLTRLINGGDLKGAREQALMNSQTPFLPSLDLKVFSGYLTVDEATNSNLYFAFYPAQEDPQNAPIILWVNSMPGYSSERAINMELGSFGMGEDGQMLVRNKSLTKTQSVLMIDSPVGTGFSFTHAERDYANTAGEEAVQLVAALRQFYTIFPEFLANDLFLGGENFAAAEIPAIVKQIENGNCEGKFKINLKGAIVGSPYITRSQINHGQHLLDLGIIDENQKKLFDESAAAIWKLYDNGQFKEGFQRYLDESSGPNSLVSTSTGFKSFSNALKSEIDPITEKFENFVHSQAFQDYSHVGGHKFVEVNLEVIGHLANDLASDHDRIWEELLNKGYRVLFYAPQFNLFSPMRGITKVVNNLKWKGAKEFSMAPRKIWRVNGEVAGYVKRAGNFYYAIVRNAGNNAFIDQPTWMLDLVRRFLNSEEF